MIHMKELLTRNSNYNFHSLKRINLQRWRKLHSFGRRTQSSYIQYYNACIKIPQISQMEIGVLKFQNVSQDYFSKQLLFPNCFKKLYYIKI